MTAFVERKARKICRQQQRRWPNKSVSLQKCQENLAPGYHFRPPLLLRLLSLVFTQKKSSESWIILLPKVRSSSVQILAAIFQVSALPKDDGVQVWAPSQQRSSRILSWAPALKANRRTCGHWFHVKNPLKWTKRWTLTKKWQKSKHQWETFESQKWWLIWRKNGKVLQRPFCSFADDAKSCAYSKFLSSNWFWSIISKTDCSSDWSSAKTSLPKYSNPIGGKIYFDFI